jgi:hypothetical protein
MKLPEKIERYNFECEAGPLTNCSDWSDLKTSTDLWIVVKRWAGAENTVKHTSGVGGWRFLAHTNEAEAQATADRMNRETFAGQKICVVRHLLESPVGAHEGGGTAHIVELVDVIGSMIGRK